MPVIPVPVKQVSFVNKTFAVNAGSSADTRSILSEHLELIFFNGYKVLIMLSEIFSYESFHLLELPETDL
jgi:hypothetical protein